MSDLLGSEARSAWARTVKEQQRSPSRARPSPSAPFPGLSSPGTAGALVTKINTSRPGAGYLDAEDRSRALALVHFVGGGWLNRVEVVPLCSLMLLAGFPPDYVEVCGSL